MNIEGFVQWVKSLSETPMTGFHTWCCMCEGVGQDLGYGHEESHLIHDMKLFHVGVHFLYGL